MRTKKEISKEIRLLEAIKTKVPKFTGFGDSNVDAIEAQIKALTEGWTEDDAWDHFCQDEECRDREEAIQAIFWMREENEAEAPSAGWSYIARV